MLSPTKTLTFQQPTTIRVSRSATRWAWTIAALNCMTLAWMLTAGQWLDDQENLLSMATWNGHHRIVAAAVGCALVALAVMAPLTRGFSHGTQGQLSVVAAAGFVSVLAVAGVLALALPLMALVLGVGLLARLAH